MSRANAPGGLGHVPTADMVVPETMIAGRLSRFRCRYTLHKLAILLVSYTAIARRSAKTSFCFLALLLCDLAASEESIEIAFAISSRDNASP